MRFLILTQYFPPEIGAPQVRLSAVARELVRLGHEVEIVTAMPNYPKGRIFPGYRRSLCRRDVLDGIPVRRVWLYASMGAGFKRMLNYGTFTLASVLGLALSRRPHFVFVESPPLFLSIPGFIAAKLWRARTIFNVADLWPDSVRELGVMHEGLALRFADWLERWTYRHFSFVTAVTEGMRQTLIEKKHVPPDRVLFLPNGVDTELFKPGEPDWALAAELGLQDKKVILCAGTMGIVHGLDVAISAMQMLRAELPDVVLLFVGSGSEKARIEQAVRQKGLPNVRFLDPVPLEHVVRLYRISFAGLASHKNLPLLDGARASRLPPAMASGKPVICSVSGETARLVEAAKAGICVPPEDAAALADAIRRLVSDPARAAELGRNGRRFVEENLSWRALVQDWLRQLGVPAAPATPARDSS